MAGALTAWLLRRKVRHRALGAARGEVIEVPCLFRRPAHEGRWLRGRMTVGPTTMTWKPRTRAGADVSLPAGATQVGLRAPSRREGIMRMNPRCTIVECASPEGSAEIAVMPNELGHVLHALSRNEAEESV